MKNIFAATIVATLFAGTAFAEGTVTAVAPDSIVTGSVEVELTENNTTNKSVIATTLGLGFASQLGNTFGSFNLKAKDGTTIAVDKWKIGTEVAGAVVSFGDQDGIFLEDVSGKGHGSVIDPVTKESLQLSAYGASVAVGFDDIRNDVSDLDNVQVAYTLGTVAGSLAGALDYNTDTKESVFGARIDSAEIAGIAVGGIVTYGTLLQTYAFEVDSTLFGATVYLNGDENDFTENVGFGYSTIFNGVTVGSDVNYNFDTAQLTPTVSAKFSF